MSPKYQIDYNDEMQIVSFLDDSENTVIIITKKQVEGLLEWYCKEFNRILV